jgi:hypothetical protein
MKNQDMCPEARGMGQEERGKLGREVGVVEKVASEVAEVW